MIRADIQQTWFINYLNNVHLSADEHLLNLPEIIFSLMKIPNANVQEFDAIQTGYMKLIRETSAFLNDNEELNRRAENIYHFLDEARNLKPIN